MKGTCKKPWGAQKGSLGGNLGLETGRSLVRPFAGRRGSRKEMKEEREPSALGTSLTNPGGDLWGYDVGYSFPL